MTPKSKSLLLAAIVVAVLGSGLYIWWNAPVRAATRALLSIVDTLKVEENDSQISRQGKAARLARAVADPVEIHFTEAGRNGPWSPESLQVRYVSGALAAKSITIKLENLTAEKTTAENVLINATLKATYSGAGATHKSIDRPCRWLMTKRGGNWVIAAFTEADAAE